MKEVFKSVIGIVLILVYYACEQKNQPVQLFKKMKVEKLTNGKYGNTFIEVDHEVLNSIQGKDSITVYLPHNDGSLILDLKASNSYINIHTSIGESYVFHDTSNYTGTLRDDPNSIVSFSLSSSLSGSIISEKYGNLSVVPTGATTTNYLVYNSLSQSEPLEFNCMTKDTFLNKIELPDNSIQRLVINNKVVTVDYEVVYDTYKAFGTEAAVINWLSGMFNAVKTLYKADAFNVALKSIYIHKIPDSYSLTADIALEQVRQLRKNDPNFKGTFTHLVRAKTGGAMSGIAYVSTMCQKDYRFGYVEPMFTWANLPAYSWSINVLSHELGHNCGAPHTHSCLWPGGAIDNCYTPEGSCSPGPPPTNGGTIMSYCHMKSYGMNFNNGFGEKPKALIQSKIDASNCLEILGTPVDTVKPNLYDLISLNKPSQQSSTYTGGFAYPYKGQQPPQSFPASYAFDSDINTFNRSDRELSPYIQVDLVQSCDIKRIVVRPRIDCCLNLSNFNITVDGSLVFTRNGSLISNKDSVSVDLVNTKGKIVKLTANQSWYNSVTGTYLQLADFKIYGNCNGVITLPPPPLVCKDSTVFDVYKIVRDSMVPKTIKVCR